jgi:NAD-dependent dihydropyrimidine dehydrogenase PreA subunit
MALRTIIEIDDALCDGCGICIDSCAEGALQLIDGKARLVSESYCDGLGACLKECPQGAIRTIQRNADPFDEIAVANHLLVNQPRSAALPACPTPLPMVSPGHAGGNGGGCPGSALRHFQPMAAPESVAMIAVKSELGHWPVQLMLVPPQAPFLLGADLLICADCVPFAVPDFHDRYLKGKALVVGCPKLDDLAHYLDKLTAIFKLARPKSVTVLRMEVPCCGGITQATVEARNRSGSDLSIEVHTVGIRGGSVTETVPPPVIR